MKSVNGKRVESLQNAEYKNMEKYLGEQRTGIKTQLTSREFSDLHDPTLSILLQSFELVIFPHQNYKTHSRIHNTVTLHCTTNSICFHSFHIYSYFVVLILY